MAKNLMIRYVVETKPNEMKKMVVKYGLPPATSQNDLFKKINYIVMKMPVNALADIVSVHPDKDIILKLSNPSLTSKTQNEITEGKSNACGCSHGVNGSSDCSGCQSKAFNVTGNSNAELPIKSSSDIERTILTDEDGLNKVQTMPLQQKIDITKKEATPVTSSNSLFTKENMPLLALGSLALVFGVIVFTKNR